MRDTVALDAIRSSLYPMLGTADHLDALIDEVGEVSFVLIGEASHGTHEFYSVRAAITRRLIAKYGFLAVAVEADWPDAHRVDQYVRGRGSDNTADQALSGFTRFPRWMWRNRDVQEFAEWLREYNTGSHTQQAGFYGLDLYSMYSSRTEVIRYLDKVDPEAARRARERYACFDHYAEDEQGYGMAAGFSVSESCEQEVLQQLTELQRRSWEYMHRDGVVAEDAFFSAEQNARLVRNAEEYYRSMFRGRVSTWNLRDRHMAETLHSLAAWLEKRHGRSKIVVWEHNSHLGDARATEMSRRGEYNVGQLVRQRYPGQSFLIGFTSHAGTVTAANDWGGEAETKRIRPSLPGSWESLFHQTGTPSFFPNFHENPALASALSEERLERAIGVIYRPQTERISHYFHAHLPDQFDAVIHIDTTRALEPLDKVAEVTADEVPETFPSGV